MAIMSLVDFIEQLLQQLPLKQTTGKFLKIINIKMGMKCKKKKPRRNNIKLTLTLVDFEKPTLMGEPRLDGVPLRDSLVVGTSIPCAELSVCV